MANTSAEELASALAAVLHYGNGTGSVNLYMAHGGSNWGFWAGQAAESLNYGFLRTISNIVSSASQSDAAMCYCLCLTQQFCCRVWRGEWSIPSAADII